MARQKYVQTRMEKSENTMQDNAAAPLQWTEIAFQLEGGEEECQIKRLHLTQGSESIWHYELYLGDEAMTGSQPIQRLLIDMVGGPGSGSLDRTTAIRVPRDWHLLARIQNSSTAVQQINAQTTIHYKVLS